MSTETSWRERAETLSKQNGLVFLGVASLDYREDADRLTQWLSEKRHADLHYLEKNHALRTQPAGLLEGASAAVVLALPYFLPEMPSPQIARYARFADYHRVLREKAEHVARGLFLGGTFRVTVDSAPLLERALAVRTRRGFVGKNTLYIHPEHGSFLLLGEILTTEKIALDTPVPQALDRKTRDGGCGPCGLCQTACPTGALDRAYTLQTDRCLSYWTIEQRGTIPEEFWPWIAEYYFGCDLCQLACPYNKHAAKPPSDWSERVYPPVERVAVMSQQEYETHFGGTPLTRAKRSGLRRNALIALAVRNHPSLDQALAHIPCDSDPVLEATAQQIRAYLG